MKSTQYNQSLTPKKASKGIEIITENANSLLADAELLFANNRYERTVTLSILAIEEIGKIPILRSILLEDGQKDLNKVWKNFRTHQEKNWGLFFSDYIKDGAENIDDLKFMFIDDKSKDKVENLKQLSIYTDYFKGDKWSIPSKVIDEKLAKTILKQAQFFVNQQNSHLTTEKELKLWIKHMKPVWKKDMSLMKAGMVKFYEEALELEILDSSIDIEKVQRFINYESDKNTDNS
ncbi:AbiV family abortive infection protein [Gracilimonas sp. Q87]|uniref:AbiV family abortive infection protein n=1 Tax=Gracilimonas sp. Q87 TaxID=3384766 RepID=UPI003983FB5E